METQPPLPGHGDRPVAFGHSLAEQTHELALPGEVRLARYNNADEWVFYEEPERHTFSLYLDGGYQTHRTDVSAPSGAPGKCCLMPAGSYSAWKLGEPQHFMHLYFPDDYLKRLALQVLDVDPRRVALPQLTFFDSERLNALAHHSLLGLDWRDDDSAALLSHGVQTLLLHLLRETGLPAQTPETQWKAGLSPTVKRRVLAYIDAHYARKISVADLAAEAQLSEFHFTRMFRVSFADSPAQFVNAYRVERLKDRLRRSDSRDTSLAQLALEHGFASQSHMGQVFKQLTGTTPGRYQRQVG